ncbi:MAG TPA: hypothetical protein DCG88_04140 [Sphingobacterium sp.]|nr:hypothetical protein [Sphingobacterium sp.]
MNAVKAVTIAIQYFVILIKYYVIINVYINLAKGQFEQPTPSYDKPVRSVMRCQKQFTYIIAQI